MSRSNGASRVTQEDCGKASGDESSPRLPPYVESHPPCMHLSTEQLSSSSQQSQTSLSHLPRAATHAEGDDSSKREKLF